MSDISVMFLTDPTFLSSYLSYRYCHYICHGGWGDGVPATTEFLKERWDLGEVNDWHISLAPGHIDFRYLPVEFKSVIDGRLELF